MAPISPEFTTLAPSPGYTASARAESCNRRSSFETQEFEKHGLFVSAVRAAEIGAVPMRILTAIFSQPQLQPSRIARPLRRFFQAADRDHFRRMVATNREAMNLVLLRRRKV